MTNFGAKIFNNAVGALSAHQAVIANRGNNIANVNTPGYTRRVVDLQTRVTSGNATTINVGSGVQIGEVRRITDKFLEKLLREAVGQQSKNEIKNEFLSRVENLFNLTGERNTIGSTLTAFFTSLNDLSANPASIELRSNVVQRAQDLVDSIKSTYNSLATLQTEADQRIETEIPTVNSLTTEIARLNTAVATREGGGSVNRAVDERDQRDQLLKQLAEKLSFSSLELADGTVTVSLSSGFPLVVGSDSRNLEVSTDPSFASGTLPQSLGGGILSYIVYDYNSGSGNSHIDLSQVIQDGEGTIAGLMGIRGYASTTNTTPFQADGVLVEVASRVEALTRSLLTSFNETYLGPDRDSGTAGHQPSSGDLDGGTPSVFGFFDFNYSGVKDRGGTPDGLPTTTDLDDISTTDGVGNYSSLLQLTSIDPRDIAAALDSGTGPPAAAIFAPGDGRNLLSLAALQSTEMSLSAGSFSLTATWDDSYVEMVGHIGNVSATSDVAAAVARDNFQTVSNKRDQTSAVSLDEEFTSLITAQRAYQASAKMIRTGDLLFEEILKSI